MILSLERLRDFEFAIGEIWVIRQKPTFRQRRNLCRKLNGFVYVLKGKCRFSYKDGAVTLEPGGLCYLPYGSNHNFEILADETEIYRLDFHITVGSEVVLFSDVPMLVSHMVSDGCAEKIRRLAEKYAFAPNTVAKTELMCGILREVSHGVDSRKNQRLEPAVRYLQNHMTEMVYSKQLAKLCNLSVAQFYAVFREEYGTTPMAYREKLLMQRAKGMLADSEFSVGEVADALGFESPAYFSRFFKKHEGISPSAYSRTGKDVEDEAGDF